MNFQLIQRIFAVALSFTLSIYMWMLGMSKHLGWERMIIIAPMPTLLLLMKIYFEWKRGEIFSNNLIHKNDKPAIYANPSN